MLFKIIKGSAYASKKIIKAGGRKVDEDWSIRDELIRICFLKRNLILLTWGGAA